MLHEPAAWLTIMSQIFKSPPICRWQKFGVWQFSHRDMVTKSQFWSWSRRPKACSCLRQTPSLWKPLEKGPQWKDPTGKACNAAGSSNGVDISRWGAGVKISRILKSRIPFTFTGNLAHDYLSSFSQETWWEMCEGSNDQKSNKESMKTGTRIERSWC